MVLRGFPLLAWRAVALGAFSGAAVAGAAIPLAPNEFAATVTVGTAGTVEEMRTYAPLAEGAWLARAVVGEVGLDEPADAVGERLDVEVRAGTTLLAATATDPSPERAREIETAVRFADVDRPRKAIVMTSVLSHDGKEIAACDLAVTLARAGSKVVVVEADLRGQHATGLFGLPSPVGLTDVLAGQLTLDDALRTWHDELVTVLPAGSVPPSPSRLLASRRMATLLAELRNRYDTVLLNAPPVLDAADAAVLGGMCDGVLLVVRRDETTRRQVTRALGLLSTARLIGIVLTLPNEQDTGRRPRHCPVSTHASGHTGTADATVVRFAPRPEDNHHR
jgi:capsular exopolysaccharide synthesis family protein